MQSIKALFIISLLAVTSCGKYIASDFQFPDQINTADHKIAFQEKKTYSINGVYADNQFDGARLNNIVQLNDSTFSAKILPENFPINKSPWYAFKLWSDEPRKINLILDYEKAPHRYNPKLSYDGEHWQLLDSSLIYTIDSGDAVLELNLSPDTLWLAGQEIINSSHVKVWCNQQAEHPEVAFSVIGKSKLGRDMYFLEIGNGEPKGKDILVVISRQHPPEVTGYMAMEAFIEKILSDNKLSRDFRTKYRILVFPLMNPDGVDMGHWRHNAGGIDMNRDWGYYRQPETRLVADYIVRDSKTNKGDVILGLDFHSTQKDLYYTFDSTFVTSMYNFHEYWIENIGEALPEYDPDHQPGKLNQPISKGWFLKQFNAESITYEIGDDTPRDFIRLKGETAGMEMMKLLIMR
jgi:hypothetical protein